MAKRSPCLLVLALAELLLAFAAAAAAAAAPALAPSADCMGALIGLVDCVSYVQEGSTVTTPDPSCCSGLKDVVRKEVACLCQIFQGGQNFGISLNMTKALQLPAACKVKTPPFSKCHVSVPGAYTASPGPAPSPSSGAPFFGQSPSPSFFGQSPSPSPSSSTPSGSSAATGSQTGTPAPSPASSGAAGLSAPPGTFFAAATLLMMYLAV